MGTKVSHALPVSLAAGADDCGSYACNALMGDKLDLQIAMYWDEIFAYDSGKNLLRGTLTMLFDWSSEDALKVFGPSSDIHKHVGVANLFPGSSTVVRDVFAGPSAYSMGNTSGSRMVAAVQYAGEFVQYSRETYCYPFEVREMIVSIFRAPAPLPGAKVNLRLFCPHPGCVGYTEDDRPVEHVGPLGDRVLVSTQSNVTKSFHRLGKVGFNWDSLLKCNVSSDASRINCAVVVRRNWATEMITHIVPGAILSILGFASFLIPVNLAMPRVGVSMICLLAFVSQTSIVLQHVPSWNSWLTIYYVWSMCIMSFNMLGHIMSFAFEDLCDLIDELSVRVVFLLYVFMALFWIASSGCEQLIASGLQTPVVVATALLGFAFLCSFGHSVWRHREQIKGFHEMVKSKTTHHAQRTTLAARKFGHHGTKTLVEAAFLAGSTKMSESDDPIGEVDTTTLSETRRVLQSIVMALEEDVKDREVRFGHNLSVKSCDPNSGSAESGTLSRHSMISRIPEGGNLDPSLMDAERGSKLPPDILPDI